MQGSTQRWRRPGRRSAVAGACALLAVCAAGAPFAGLPGAHARAGAHVAAAAAGPIPASSTRTTSIVVGRSVRGTPLRAWLRGNPAAPRVLVVGVVHGDERAGRAAIARLLAAPAPTDLDLVLVPTANPDGERANTRQNAHRVDLNRNFPWRWRGGGRPGDVFFPGPAAASEPETRAVVRLVQRFRPLLSVWYHQHLTRVLADGGPQRERLERLYAALVGLPFGAFTAYRGTAITWENHVLPRGTAFVVELPAGPLPARSAARHAQAVLAVARRALRDTVAPAASTG